MARLGQAVRTLRKRRGLTQGQLAIYAQVDQSYISQIENDHVESVGGEILRRLAERLGTTADYLLGMTPNWRRPEHTTTPQTELEWQLLDKFRDLSLEEQRYIIAQLDLALDIFSRPAYRIIDGEDDDEAQGSRSGEGTDQSPPST